MFYSRTLTTFYLSVESNFHSCREFTILSIRTKMESLVMRSILIGSRDTCQFLSTSVNSSTFGRMILTFPRVKITCLMLIGSLFKIKRLLSISGLLLKIICWRMQSDRGCMGFWLSTMPTTIICLMRLKSRML